jgi:chorismate mutase-like protein
MGLEAYRKQIDAIDNQLLQLFNERAQLALRIGEEKQRQGLPVYVPEREKQIIERVQQLNRGPLTSLAVRELFTSIIQTCRNLEKA